MIRTIQFMSKSSAEALPYDPSTAIISISDPNEKSELNYPECQVFRLEFVDKDPQKDVVLDPFLFNNEQSHDLLRFVDEIESTVDRLIVHCYMGISRSGAVAVFLNDYLEVFDPFISAYTNYNRHVYRVLVESAYGPILGVDSK